MSTPNDPLDPLFARWRADTPPLPRSVRSDVWQRIEHAEAHPGIRGWPARIEMAFSRPAFATAFIIACVLAGLFLAETRLSEAHKHRSAELERSYLRMLDQHVETFPQANPTFYTP